jgi:hypothetical protein
MPYEVVRKRVDFFKMAAVAMETAKMLKNDFFQPPKAATHYRRYSFKV